MSANFKTFAVPWVKPEIHEKIKPMTADEFGRLMASTIHGTFPRVNGSPYYMTKIPDLIGIKDRKVRFRAARPQCARRPASGFGQSLQ